VFEIHASIAPSLHVKEVMMSFERKNKGKEKGKGKEKDKRKGKEKERKEKKGNEKRRKEKKGA
jgi:hypothetical protein